MSLSCKWSLLSCDSRLIDCRMPGIIMLHVRRRNAFTSFWWQVLAVLVSVTWAECTSTQYTSSTTRYFVVSLSTSLVLPLLSGGYFLNISSASAARGLCCLRRSVDIFPGLRVDQPSCLLFASKCSNSEPAGPGQKACPSFSAEGSSKRVTIRSSRYFLVTRPFTGAINCLLSWRRHPTSSSWHPRRRSVASSREVEHRRTGQIRLAYQLPMCAAVHLRPSLPKNSSKIAWELEAFELQQTSTSWPMNSCAIGVAVQCRPRRHFLRSLSPATEHAKLVYWDSACFFFAWRWKSMRAEDEKQRN